MSSSVKAIDRSMKSSSELQSTTLENPLSVTISTVSNVADSSLKSVKDSKYLNKPDMDIQYAISLLKKDDHYIDVYSHLEAVLNKMLSERPSNPVENFELYSHILKLTYPTVNTRFESVFVDNINIMACLRNLQLYKCALNSQLEKQKRYERQKNAKEVKFSKYKKKPTYEPINDEFNGFKQNLREANFLFNKAGCGLSENEVSVISTTMNHMAKLNKFKSLRYWGKIFGVKKNYYVIECEWSESELHRKLSAGNVVSSETVEPKPNSFDSGKQPMSLSQLKDAPGSKQDLSVEYNGDEASSKATEILYQNSKENSDQFSFSSFVMPNDSKLVTKVGSKNMIPPEIQGFGTNKSVYFVTNELNEEWIELPPVKPNHVNEARRIKYFLTGDLNAVVNTYPKFNGLEIHYLRAQIARISSSTHICPEDFYEISSVEENQLQTPYSLLKSLPQLAKRIVFNCVPNINYKPAANSKLMKPDCWVHVKSNIGDKGVTRQWAYLMSTKSFLAEGDSKGVSGMILEDEDYISDYGGEVLDSKMDLLINLAKDSTVGKTNAWKGEQCSKFLPRDSCVAMKSNIWPGAMAVSCKSQSEFLYVGWAQKYDFIGFNPLMEQFYEEHFTGKHITECDDPTNKQENEYNIHIQELEQKNLVFEQLSGEVYEGDEKILTNYTYD